MKKLLALALALLFCLSLAACGGKEAEEAEADFEVVQSEYNTIPWNDDFYGVTIPAPRGYDCVAVFEPETDFLGYGYTNLYIDRLSYDSFRQYCKTLQKLDGWEPSDTSDLWYGDYKDLPKKEPAEEIQFEGSMKGLGNITLKYDPAEPEDAEGRILNFHLYVNSFELTLDFS